MFRTIRGFESQGFLASRLLYTIPDSAVSMFPLGRARQDEEKQRLPRAARKNQDCSIVHFYALCSCYCFVNCLTCLIRQIDIH
jgi:hypothetical protein